MLQAPQSTLRFHSGGAIIGPTGLINEPSTVFIAGKLGAFRLTIIKFKVLD